MIVGSSRFPKTEAIRLCAKVQPAHCRLIEVREGNALSDLVREVAKSLGIQIVPQIVLLEAAADFRRVSIPLAGELFAKYAVSS